MSQIERQLDTYIQLIENIVLFFMTKTVVNAVSRLLSNVLTEQRRRVAALYKTRPGRPTVYEVSYPGFHHSRPWMCVMSGKMTGMESVLIQPN